MARHQFDDPIDEHTQLGADCPIRLAFANLNAILQVAGATLDDVVDVTYFIVDLEKNFETIWPIVAEHWGNAPYPTATAIGVTWLTGFQFEIKVTVKLPARG